MRSRDMLMRRTTTIRAKSPADLLATIPALVGFDPEYGMAELLDTMLSNGHPPEWVFVEPDAG